MAILTQKGVDEFRARKKYDTLTVVSLPVEEFHIFL